MIEKLQKISAQIFKNALKTYTLKEVLTHKKSASNNLVELLSLYPNRGVGFNIKRKNWVDGVKYQIKRVELKSHRFGAFYGIKYSNTPTEKQKAEVDYPHRIQGLNKRGIWTYDLGNFTTFRTDNDVIYNKADYEAFIRLRGNGVPKTVKSSTLEQASKQEITPPEANSSE